MRVLILPLVLIMFLVVSTNAEEVIKRYSGSETVSVGPMTLPDGWQVKWENEGHYLQILMNSADSVPLGYVVEQTGPGKGLSEKQKGGVYLLDINVSGPWEVKIIKAD